LEINLAAEFCFLQWTGSLKGIKLQIWGTWLFYAVLVDLGDAVADELALPFDRYFTFQFSHFKVAAIDELPLP
jgi:hypothetical protein